MTKYIIFILVFFEIKSCLFSQPKSYEDYWGDYNYYNPENGITTVLELCENNTYALNDSLKIVKEGEVNDIVTISEFTMNGLYEIVDSTLSLYSETGEEILEFNIIDSLNFQILKSSKVNLMKDDIFHRESAFYKGHICGYSIYNYDYIRWQIMESNDCGESKYECYYVSIPGKFYLLNYYKKICLPKSIYK